MEQVLDTVVQDEVKAKTRPAKRVDIYELMLLRYSPAMFASVRRGEMANPFRPRSLPNRIRALSLVYTVEEAVARTGARIVPALVNQKTKKPYGRDSQTMAEYLASCGTNLESALFEEDLPSIAGFKKAMLPKLGDAKLTYVEQSEAEAKCMNRRVKKPQVYRLESNGAFSRNVIIETTSNWDTGDNSSRAYGFNARTFARALVRGVVAGAVTPAVHVLLAEVVPPYRMNIIKPAKLPLNGMVDEYLRAMAVVDGGYTLHDNVCELWPRDLNERAHELWAV